MRHPRQLSVKQFKEYQELKKAKEMADVQDGSNGNAPIAPPKADIVKDLKSELNFFDQIEKLCRQHSHLEKASELLATTTAAAKQNRISITKSGTLEEQRQTLETQVQRYLQQVEQQQSKVVNAKTLLDAAVEKLRKEQTQLQEVEMELDSVLSQIHSDAVSVDSDESVSCFMPMWQKEIPSPVRDSVTTILDAIPQDLIASRLDLSQAVETVKAYNTHVTPPVVNMKADGQFPTIPNLPSDRTGYIHDLHTDKLAHRPADFPDSTQSVESLRQTFEQASEQAAAAVSVAEAAEAAWASAISAPTLPVQLPTIAPPPKLPDPPPRPRRTMPSGETLTGASEPSLIDASIVPASPAAMPPGSPDPTSEAKRRRKHRKEKVSAADDARQAAFEQELADAQADAEKAVAAAAAAAKASQAKPKLAKPSGAGSGGRVIKKKK